MGARRLSYLLAAALAVALASSGTAQASGAGSCARLAAPGGAVVNVSPAQAGELPAIVAGAPAGATIRLADGTYPIGTITMSRPGVTLRSASGHPGRVVLDGAYGPSALIHPFANNLTVAELTLTRARDHLVHSYPAAGGPDLSGLRLYRVRMVDSGEQFLKVNSNAARSAWVDSGTVACSQFVMTAAGRANIERAFGCYTGGIDVHSGRGWRVRDSTFAGIYCEDGELAEHAIHFWKGARGTLVENNVISNCARAIGFGLGDTGEGRAWADDPYPGVGYIGHYDGVIRGNSVLADIPQYDTGIELAQAERRACAAQHAGRDPERHPIVQLDRLPLAQHQGRGEQQPHPANHGPRRRGGHAGRQRRGHAGRLAGESTGWGLPPAAGPERRPGPRRPGGRRRARHRRARA